MRPESRHEQRHAIHKVVGLGLVRKHKNELLCNASLVLNSTNNQILHTPLRSGARVHIHLLHLGKCIQLWACGPLDHQGLLGRVHIDAPVILLALRYLDEILSFGVHPQEILNFLLDLHSAESQCSSLGFLIHAKVTIFIIRRFFVIISNARSSASLSLLRFLLSSTTLSLLHSLICRLGFQVDVLKELYVVGRLQTQLAKRTSNGVTHRLINAMLILPLVYKFVVNLSKSFHVTFHAIKNLLQHCPLHIAILINGETPALHNRVLELIGIFSKGLRQLFQNTVIQAHVHEPFSSKFRFVAICCLGIIYSCLVSRALMLLALPLCKKVSRLLNDLCQRLMQGE
mmetsp:Transcript_74281/g.135701  ORF Transcript_74281/g.135701 Transcript_74281/m.135701 type:complete len:343 (-) Transcript_74281:462-1490(-)